MERQLASRIIHIEVEPGLPLIHVDSILIEQLLMNLIDNAVKYSPDNSPIDVAVRQTPAGVELEVADRGCGFTPGDEVKVFDLFYRGSDGRSDQRGTGIGLAICRAIAEVHNGKISASNRAGGGATVRLNLPLNEVPPQVAERALEPILS
jgi:two-component system sensor histidine kinase KdpD